MSRAIRAGDVTASDIAKDSLARIASVDGKVSAFCETFAERVTEQATELDRKQQAGETLGALAGVPIASKDNLLVANQNTTAGSRMLSTFRGPFTATSLARLEEHDAMLLGRTNMDEFGMGSTTETSAWQKTRNPFGENLVPGGSSGGSAVAVSADMCPIAIGSDTGGSVRQPAALCGVSGLKPTYGRVPRYGLIAYASSLDCVGAIARTAEDLALWLDCASGQDAADATSLPTPATVAHLLQERSDLNGIRIGVPRALNGEGIDEEVLAATQAATAHMQELGATVIECDLPSAKHAVPAYYLLATAEAASNLARYDGVHYGWRAETGDASRQSSIETTTQTRSEGFGKEVQLRILLGTFASSYGYSAQFYERACMARRALQREFQKTFEQCDVLLCPTSPTAAPQFGDSEDDPLARYLWDALTVPASLAGIPALSIPCGNTNDGRPIGMQLMAPHHQDGRLLQLAHVFQSRSEHHLRRPQL
ncbi:MAG: aspartyl-tRNA(Asn)/glutamyl-tRNA(Gln) amidotransferase subunit A [Planctomycetota bacterium]|jgi:aspartyl-tRNA(Asn)/glutamyl-tRNA(Gln) amidotransferase subunit A